jgi:hypothetical protein
MRQRLNDPENDPDLLLQDIQREKLQLGRIKQLIADWEQTTGIELTINKIGGR